MLRFYAFFRVNFPLTLFCGVTGVTGVTRSQSKGFSRDTCVTHRFEGVTKTENVTPVTPWFFAVSQPEPIYSKGMTQVTPVTLQNIRNGIFLMEQPP
jgi:cytochrome c oxidase assembly protein Cox11